MSVWLQWAQEMRDQGYTQKQCPGCGKYVIWEMELDSEEPT